MKKKAIRKTIKQLLIIIPVFLIIFSLVTIIGGERQSNQPYGMGAAPYKHIPMSLKGVREVIPEILFATLIVGIIGFPLQYEYNLNKLKKEEKEGKEQEEKKEEGEGAV